MKYTHGDWKISGEWGEGGYRIAAISGGLNLHIAGVDGRDENIDNARLIAAAPDLYEALQAVCESFNRLGTLSGSAQEKVEKALAKAEATNDRT